MIRSLKFLLAGLLFCCSAYLVVHAFAQNSEYASALPDDYLIGACDKQNKCGYINIKQEVKIPFEYKIVDSDINTNGVAYVTKPENGNYKDHKTKQLYGLIDKTGKVLAECKYYNIDKFSDGMARVKHNGKFGYFDKNGKLVIPIVYKDANRFTNGLAVVSYDGQKFGVTDKSGKTVIPFEYDKIWNFSGEYTSVLKNGKWGIIDRHNKLVTLLKYSYIEKFYKEFAVVKLGSNIGILNCKTGKYVLEPEYDSDYALILSNKMHNKYEICKKDAKGVKYCGMCDYDGKIMVPVKYKRVAYKGDGLYEIISHDGKVTYKHPDNELQFLDKQNNLDKIYKYKDGYLTATSAVEGDGVGLLDKNGKWIVPPNYSEIFDFHDGMVKAETYHRPCFYNKEGKLVVPDGYMFATDFKDGFSVVSKEGKLFLGEGLIDTNGKIRIPTRYQEVESIGNGLYKVSTHAFWEVGILDANGKTVIPIGKYSGIQSK